MVKIAGELGSELPSDSPDYEADIQAFQTVVSAMSQLDEQRRVRLISAVAAFFDIGRFGTPLGARSAPLGNESFAARADDSFSADRSLSPKEFLLQKKPSNAVERVACLAYYLAHYRNTPHFKTLDLSKLNTEAAQIKFSNATAAVDNAARAGLLTGATKGNKQVSAIGEIFVQALPDREAARAAIASARPRRRRKANRIVSVEGSSE
jgi:hypothetical protein